MKPDVMILYSNVIATNSELIPTKFRLETLDMRSHRVACHHIRERDAYVNCALCVNSLAALRVGRGMACGRKVGVPKTTGRCPVGNAVASPKSIYE